MDTTATLLLLNRRHWRKQWLHAIAKVNKEYKKKYIPVADGVYCNEEEFVFNYREYLDAADSSWFIENVRGWHNGDDPLLPANYYFTSGLHCLSGFKDDVYIVELRKCRVLLRSD